MGVKEKNAQRIEKNLAVLICILTGARGIVVVKALCYKPEGRGIASR
jgi:hypothetical protein